MDSTEERPLQIKDLLDMQPYGFAYVAYMGTLRNSDQYCVGLVLSKPYGNTDGIIDDVRYFRCGENKGLFVQVRKDKVARKSTLRDFLFDTPAFSPDNIRRGDAVLEYENAHPEETKLKKEAFMKRQEIQIWNYLGRMMKKKMEQKRKEVLEQGLEGKQIEIVFESETEDGVSQFNPPKENIESRKCTDKCTHENISCNPELKKMFGDEPKDFKYEEESNSGFDPRIHVAKDFTIDIIESEHSTEDSSSSFVSAETEYYSDEEPEIVKIENIKTPFPDLIPQIANKNEEPTKIDISETSNQNQSNTNPGIKINKPKTTNPDTLNQNYQNSNEDQIDRNEYLITDLEKKLKIESMSDTLNFENSKKSIEQIHDEVDNISKELSLAEENIQLEKRKIEMLEKALKEKGVAIYKKMTEIYLDLYKVSLQFEKVSVEKSKCAGVLLRNVIDSIEKKDVKKVNDALKKFQDMMISKGSKMQIHTQLSRFSNK